MCQTCQTCQTSSKKKCIVDRVARERRLADVPSREQSYDVEHQLHRARQRVRGPRGDRRSGRPSAIKFSNGLIYLFILLLGARPTAKAPERRRDSRKKIKNYRGPRSPLGLRRRHAPRRPRRNRRTGGGSPSLSHTRATTAQILTGSPFEMLNLWPTATAGACTTYIVMSLQQGPRHKHFEN